VSGRRFLGLLGCGLGLLGLTVAGLYAQREKDIDGFVAVALAQGAVYLLALGLIWRSPASLGGLALILGIAVAVRIAVLAAPPFLSSDVYRYVWDGRVIAAGVNPYCYLPVDPHLASLRDEAIFPRINRANYAPTIYPPMAEAIFFAVTRISERVTAMKLAMVVFEATAIWLLLQLLIGEGLPALRIIVYAWHPLPVWEFAGSGHIDAAIIALVALALWSRRRRRRGWLTGLALAAGTLVKFYPAVLFPALWRRWEWRMPALFAAVLVLAYLPFLGVGWRVFGFLPGYLVEEGFASGGAGFYPWTVAQAILPLAGVSDIAYLAAAACLLAGLAVYLAARRTDAQSDVFGAALLAAAFIFLLSPHYPWYFAWLIVFACLLPWASLLWLTLASFLLYLVPVGSQLVRDHHRFLVESAIYVPFLALAAIDLWRQRPKGAAEEQLKHGEHTPR
jgi:alpha-1,6-mannosyltransferase